MIRTLRDPAPTHSQPVGHTGLLIIAVGWLGKHGEENKMETRPTYQVYAEYRKPGMCRDAKALAGAIASVIASGLFSVAALGGFLWLLITYTTETMAVSYAGFLVIAGWLMFRYYRRGGAVRAMLSGALFALFALNAINVVMGVFS